MKKFFTSIFPKRVPHRVIRLFAAATAAALAITAAGSFAGVTTDVSRKMPKVAAAVGNKPERPVITHAKAGTGFVSITWKPAAGACSYIVQKKKGGRWKRVKRIMGRDRCIYFEKKAAAGRVRTYRVGSVSVTGRKSAPSGTVRLKPGPGVPEIISLSKNTIAWEPVRGAEKYVVKRKMHKGRWKTIGKTKKTSFYIGKVRKKAEYEVAAKGPKGTCTRSDVFTRKYMICKGKKMLIEGDSHFSPVFSWAQRSARLLGFDYTCRAVNGSTVAGYANSICSRAGRMGFRGYDVILLRGGSNDYGHSVRLGTPESVDEMTFYGAYRSVLKRIRQDAPHAIVILVTPTEKRAYNGRTDAFGYSSRNAAGCTLDDYRQAVINLGSEYGCWVYDMKDCRYITRKNLSRSTVDYMHPTPRTHEKISNDFVKYMVHDVMK